MSLPLRHMVRPVRLGAVQHPVQLLASKQAARCLSPVKECLSAQCAAIANYTIVAMPVGGGPNVTLNAVGTPVAGGKVRW